MEVDADPELAKMLKTPAKSEEELEKMKKEKKEKQAPRRKMYRFPEQDESIISITGVSSESIRKNCDAIEAALQGDEDWGNAKVEYIEGNLVRIYPNKKRKRELNRAYRDDYFKRKPEKKALTEDQKKHRQEYNKREEVKQRKLFKNQVKSEFYRQQKEKFEDEFNQLMTKASEDPSLFKKRKCCHIDLFKKNNEQGDRSTKEDQSEEVESSSQESQ